MAARTLAAASAMILLGGSPPLAAATAQQQTAGLRVIVTSAETAEPIAGATVRVGGEHGKAGRTDEDGRARIGGIEPGTHDVVVEASGYGTGRTTLTFEALRIVDFAFALDAEPIPLEPIGVTVEGRSAKLELVGFYERANIRAGAGTFLTPEEVGQRVLRSSRMGDILRGLSRIRVIGSGAKQGLATRRGVASIERPCRPRVWLDGVRLGPWASADINIVVSPQHVAAIEIYAGPAETPVEFDVTGSACGAVLIWTGARPAPP